MKELILGGARSGKSMLAETRAAESGLRVVYVATAQALDGEMRRRIAHHQARRPATWGLVESPLDLAGHLHRNAAPGTCLLVDCLTLWLANLFEAHDPDAETARLCAALAAQNSPVVLVTNELGLGIVPENSLARRFRDAHGLMNQAVAAASDQVWMSVSGLPLRLKPERESP